MAASKKLNALESGDSATAMPLLESVSSEQPSELLLPDICTALESGDSANSMPLLESKQPSELPLPGISIYKPESASAMPIISEELPLPNITTSLASGDFATAMPLLESLSREQLSELTLPDERTPLHYACQHGRVDIASQLITDYKYSIESKNCQGMHTPTHCCSIWADSAHQVLALSLTKHPIVAHFQSMRNPHPLLCF